MGGGGGVKHVLTIMWLHGDWVISRKVCSSVFLCFIALFQENRTQRYVHSVALIVNGCFISVVDGGHSFGSLGFNVSATARVIQVYTSYNTLPRCPILWLLVAASGDFLQNDAQRVRHI